MLNALASLILPGLGQILSGRRARGLALFAVIAIMLGLIVWAVTPTVGSAEADITFKGNPANWRWLIVPALLWLWGIWDAASPRPVLIPVFAALIMFYVMGWQATEIDLEALAKNFDRALIILRPMLRPDFLQPKADRLETWVELEVPCSPTPPTGANTLVGTSLSLSAGCASVGETLTLTAGGLWPDSEAELVWQSPIGDFFALREPGTTQPVIARTDAAGYLTANFVVPKAIPPGIDPNRPQNQRLYVRQSKVIGGYELSTNGFFVLKGIYETIALALMATTLGTFFAIPISFLAARNLMSGNAITFGAYVIIRTLLNIVRSIESLIIAIVFVVIVGLGPFAGMLALALHTIAALAKLYSEVIEGIDPGPIEAIRATGATWLQVVRYGVVPQIVPPFTAFTIYRWDINVRASTIIGFVGGGGIGFFLVQWINLGDFRAVSASFIAILVVVMAMDVFSARIREKLI